MTNWVSPSLIQVQMLPSMSVYVFAFIVWMECKCTWGFPCFLTSPKVNSNKCLVSSASDAARIYGQSWLHFQTALRLFGPFAETIHPQRKIVWLIQTEENPKAAWARSANAGATLPLFEKPPVVGVVCAVLAGRGEPGAATINSLREGRHSSARGAPSDRRQNRWVSQSEAGSSFHPQLHQTHLHSSIPSTCLY